MKATALIGLYALAWVGYTFVIYHLFTAYAKTLSERKAFVGAAGIALFWPVAVVYIIAKVIATARQRATAERRDVP